MGFFPNIFKGSPLKIISNVVLPTLPLAVETIKGGLQLARPAIQSVTQLAQSRNQTTGIPLAQQQDFYPLYHPQPYYGGDQWGYSTISQDFSGIPPAYREVGYSPGPLGFSQDQWPEGFSR